VYELDKEGLAKRGEVLYKTGALYLDRPGVGKASDLVKVVGHTLKIVPEDCLFMIPLVYRLCEVLDRSDIAFCTIVDIIGNPNYFSQNSGYFEYRIQLANFRDQVQKLMPQTYNILMDIGGLQDIFLVEIFTGFFFNIFPHEKALVVMDNFLLDGGIVLFRFGLSLFFMFKKEIKALQFLTGEELWSYIKKKMYSNGLEFSTLCDIAFEKNRRSMTSSIIGDKTLHLPSRQQVQARFVELYNGLSKKDLLRHTSFIDLVRSSVASSSWMSGPSAQVPIASSKILSTSMLLNLGDMLFENVFGSFYPIGNDVLSPLVGIECFRLAYATYRDGPSLDILYEKCKGSSPSIVLIKSLRSEAVFGAFASASLGPPFGEAKGDVDSFVFRLDGHNCNFYPTVDIERGMRDLEPYQQVALRYARQQYVRCAKSQLTFGLSVGRSPSHVIRINEDLSMCWSGPSVTFGNKVSLLNEESPFPLLAVEVWIGPFIPVEPVPAARSDVSQLAGGGTMTLYDDEEECFESPTFANLGALNPYEETATGLQHLKLMHPSGDIDGGVLDGADEVFEAVDAAQLRAQRIAEKEAAYWASVEFKDMERRNAKKKKKKSPWVSRNDASETSSRSDHGINVAKLAHNATPVKRCGGKLLSQRSSAILSNISFDDERSSSPDLFLPKPLDKYQEAIRDARASLGIISTGVDVVEEDEDGEPLWKEEESASMGNDNNAFYSDDDCDDDLDVEDFLNAFSDRMRSHDDEDDEQDTKMVEAQQPQKVEEAEVVINGLFGDPSTHPLLPHHHRLHPSFEEKIENIVKDDVEEDSATKGKNEKISLGRPSLAYRNSLTTAVTIIERKNDEFEL
jgi:hypothetical protein